MPIRDFDCDVLFNKEVAKNIFHLKLKVKKFPESNPGQFVMIKIDDSLHILRRPFAVFTQSGNCIEIAYRVVGTGTMILSRKKKGEQVKISGPFGNGFKIRKGHNIVIAGGIGIASLFHLIKKLPKDTIVLYGAKTGQELAFIDELKKSGKTIIITTEDGSKGKKGLVTDILDSRILMNSSSIFACGPIPMLKRVSEVADNYNIECQVSLEARMACGFGVCLGCVVPVKNSDSEEKDYLRVCTDGPVFDSRKIKWDELNETIT